MPMVSAAEGIEKTGRAGCTLAVAEQRLVGDDRHRHGRRGANVHVYVRQSLRLDRVPEESPRAMNGDGPHIVGPESACRQACEDQPLLAGPVWRR